MYHPYVDRRGCGWARRTDPLVAIDSKVGSSGSSTSQDFAGLVIKPLERIGRIHSWCGIGTASNVGSDYYREGEEARKGR